ncbi:hypothetical protein BDF22DRAFT_652725 [Syncephalis plumigaleata]|nr:hypothetical protein BDF22DRAFT_652725 [Syncephalis plumigaleata]
MMESVKGSIEKSTAITMDVSNENDNGHSYSWEIDPRVRTVRLRVYGMVCSSCETSLTSGLEAISGVRKVFASSMLQLAEVHYVPGSTLKDDDSIVEQIQLLGYQAEFNEDDEPSTVTLMVVHEPSSSSALPIDKVVDLLTMQPGVYQVRMRRSTSTSSALSTQHHGSSIYTLNINYNLEMTGPRTLLNVLSTAGVQAYLPERIAINDRTRYHQRRRLSLLLICALFAIPTIVIELAFPDSLHEPTYKAIMPRDWLMLVLGTILQGFVWPFYVATYRSLRYAKQVTMDALLALSTTVGYLFSVAGIIITAATLGDIRLGMFFDMNAMLIVFFMLGRYLHQIGKHKAARALSELKGLQTDTAHLVMMNDHHHTMKSSRFTSNADTYNETMPNTDSIVLMTDLVDSSIARIYTVDIRLVQRYDELVVFTGESIPVDGFVLDGSGDVDESLITGEAIPVKKQSGARVVGGAKLVTGQLRIRVMKTSTEGTLADIGKLIESAQASKISVQKLADRIASVFCPAAIILSFVVLFVWLGLTLSGAVTNTEGYPPVIFSLNFFIAILVVACPCAVSLAVPTVLAVATGIASKLGVLVRDGNAFEQGAKVTAVVFDKTGTLTEGVFSVISYTVLSMKQSSDDASGHHDMVGAASTASKHPVSRALARHWAKYDDPEQNGVTDLVDIPGEGYTCKIDHQLVAIGKSTWITRQWLNDDMYKQTRDDLNQWVQAQETHGYTVVVAMVKDIVHAYALEDKPRDNAKEIVKWLQDAGKEVHLVSGDNQRAVERLAKQIGIALEHAQGTCLPEDKVTAIKQLQNNGHVVLFVGDGINDAPVLAQSHLGVALCSGADVSMEAARAVLMRNDLADIAVLLDLCRAVLWRIHFNFIWAFAYNTALIPSAAGVFYALNHFRIPPVIASAGSLLSVLPVIAASLLLRTFYRPPQIKHV